MRTAVFLTILLMSAASQAQFGGFLDGLFGGGRREEPRGNGASCRPGPDGTWTVLKTSWDDNDEERYSRWIQAIGRTGCNTVDKCIRSEANIYRNTDPAPGTYEFRSDCADCPYFFRMYFAWKNCLPYSYIQGVDSLDVYTPEEIAARIAKDPKWKNDPRYSSKGNKPRVRRNIVPTRAGETFNYFREHVTLQNAVFTATFRMNPELEYNIAQDTYPVAIERGNIKPGSIAYDADGHAATVYEVTGEGRIKLLNCSPGDKSSPVSYTVYSEANEYERSSPAMGVGLKNWRPFQVNAETTWGGDIIARSLTFTPNSQLIREGKMDFVQFYGTNDARDNWRKAEFSVGGAPMSFDKYTRTKLATSPMDPVQEFTYSLKDYCGNIQTRGDLVEAATAKGSHLQPHPGMPANIFNADGEWENLSTPGRDLRLRTGLQAMMENLNEQIKDLRNGESYIAYNGSDLRADLLGAYDRTAKSCTVTYTKSDGRRQTLTMDQVISRVLKIAFDPYLCPEHRWGADGSELSSCTDDGQKNAYYDGEQKIRNLLRRDWMHDAPITLDVLQSPNVRLGAPVAPDLNLRGFLAKLDTTGLRSGGNGGGPIVITPPIGGNQGTPSTDPWNPAPPPDSDFGPRADVNRAIRIGEEVIMVSDSVIADPLSTKAAIADVQVIQQTGTQYTVYWQQGNQQIPKVGRYQMAISDTNLCLGNICVGDQVSFVQYSKDRRAQSTGRGRIEGLLPVSSKLPQGGAVVYDGRSLRLVRVGVDRLMSGGLY